MNRIDTPVAAQLADQSRPRQAIQDRALQLQQVQVETVKDADKAPKPITADDVRAAAKELKTVVEVATNRDLLFDIYEDTQRMFVKVTDGGTGEVIKQIPSEDVLELQRRMRELVGMLVDEEA